MYPWIRDAAAAAALSFGSHHHHHYNHHQGQNSGLGMNGGIKGENGYPPPPNSVNDCMLALDYAHNKVSTKYPPYFWLGCLKCLQLFKIELLCFSVITKSKSGVFGLAITGLAYCKSLLNNNVSLIHNAHRDPLPLYIISGEGSNIIKERQQKLSRFLQQMDVVRVSVFHDIGLVQCCGKSS